MGDDESSDEPAPSRKTSKKKTKGTVKKPGDLNNAAENLNEVDGSFNDDARPADDDDDEDDSGGILEILNGKIQTI